MVGWAAPTVGAQEIFGLGLTDVSAGVLVVIAVLMVFTGRLIPRRQVEREVGYLQKTIAELQKQNSMLIDTAQVSAQALKGIEKAAGEAP